MTCRSSTIPRKSEQISFGNDKLINYVNYWGIQSASICQALLMKISGKICSTKYEDALQSYTNKKV